MLDMWDLFFCTVLTELGKSTLGLNFGFSTNFVGKNLYFLGWRRFEKSHMFASLKVANQFDSF